MTAEATVCSSDLAGMVVGDTAIPDVQGEQGLTQCCRYRHQRPGGRAFLHVVWMVLFGDWPRKGKVA